MTKDKSLSISLFLREGETKEDKRLDSEINSE